MSPRLIHIYGPVWITAYGFFIATGVSVFIFSAYFHSSRKQYLTNDQFFDISSSGVFFGLLGGKILYLLQEGLPAFSSFYDLIELARGGFAILGAIIGASIGVIGYALYHTISLLPVLDIAGRYAPLAHGIARWGCFFAGCCYGQTVYGSSLFTVVYTHQHSLAPLHVPLYATQVMMSIGSFVAFFLVNGLIARYRCRPAGALFVWYIMLECSNRFIVDFWRGDRVYGRQQALGQHTHPLLSSYQLIALAIISLCAVVLAVLYYSHRQKDGA